MFARDVQFVAFCNSNPKPLFANVYLHYVFDLWIEAWWKMFRRRSLRISYDDEVDALYIRLLEGECHCRTLRRTDEVSLNVGPRLSPSVRDQIRRRNAHLPAGARAHPASDTGVRTDPGVPSNGKLSLALSLPKSVEYRPKPLELRSRWVEC